MSGHSKWSQIKHKKEVTDAKRGQRFTLLSSQIKIASRAGKDPKTNRALADAIAHAKKANMPQDNIDRLLSSANDKPSKEIIYEAFGPAGVSLLIITETDNHRRTVAEIRAILTDHNGTLGNPGSTLWKFSPQIKIVTDPTSADPEQLELELIELGITDITIKKNRLNILATPELRDSILSTLKQHNLTPLSNNQTYQATQAQTISTSSQKKLERLLRELADHPNVINIYTDATS
jgi:YebC/PmpR family DNA-binding regulatory protein